MKYRRVVGNIAALATLAGGSAFVAMAGPAHAGSTADGDFPVVGKETVDVVRGSGGKVSGVIPNEPIADASGASTPEEAAKAHVQRLAPALGVNPNNLEAVDSTEVPDGNVVRFEQKVDGLEVYAGGFVASMGDSNDLNALLGEASLDGVAKADAKIDQNAATKKAIDHVAGKVEVDASGLTADIKGEMVYDPSLLNSEALPAARKVVNVNVHNANHSIDYDVLVNAGLGTVAVAVPNTSGALERKVCDAENQDYGSSDSALCDGQTVGYSLEEGGEPTGEPTVDDAYQFLYDSAVWYANYTDVDLTQLVSDGEVQGGKALRATVNVCLSDQQPDCPMANAFWNYNDGVKQMFIGGNMGTLDVIAHEVTHGVTAETAGLKYIYQSGALHEAFSDVQGEIIDLATNQDKVGTDAEWMIGDDLQDGAMRDMADPTASEQPDTMTSDLWVEDPNLQDNGGVHSNSGVGNKAGYLTAQGGEFNGYEIRGLGLAKTFKLFWSTQNLLTPGADYKDFGTALQVACEKNIGREGSFVTEDDCAQVAKVVRATELHEDASNAAPTAPYCDEGNVNRTYFEGFENRDNLTFEGSGSAGLAMADYGLAYQNTGKDAGVIWTGPAADGTIVDNGTFTQSSSVEVPENGLLRVDYATEFLAQGVSAELQYNAGDGWQSGSSLSGSVNAEPWTGLSGGWGAARYDLSSLAGQNVQFRFQVEGGDATSNHFLYVDNVKLYNCG